MISQANYARLAVLAIPMFLAAAGCAATTATDDAASEDTEEGVVTEELTSAGRVFVGTYSTPTPAMGGLVRLELRANGTYAAKYDMAMAMCVDCYRDERGTFSIQRLGGQRRLRLAPTGAAAVTYTAIKGQDLLTLKRGGRTEYLAGVGPSECNANVDCGTGFKCAPQVCLMHTLCEENNPSCCGGTCRPNRCAGAWLDQFGGCRGLADEGLPASCCN